MMTTSPKNLFSLIFLASLFYGIGGCNSQIEDTNAEYAEKNLSNTDTLYSAPQNAGELANDDINEASGLVASRTMPGTFWTHNDSGGEAAIFLVGSNGEDLGKVNLQNVVNRDWEDIAVGPGPASGSSYVYVGEIGDNEAQYGTKIIYRFLEPDMDLQNPPFLATVQVDTIAFQYPDGPRDAETLMVHPNTGDIFIVSKREEAVHLYTLPFPQATGEILEPEMIGTLPFNNVVAGDISPDGQEILLKDYWRVFHWVVENDDIAATMLNNEPVLLPYQPEPQGESVAFATDVKSYFTVSEERDNIPAVLYKYPRIEE